LFRVIFLHRMFSLFKMGNKESNGAGAPPPSRASQTRGGGGGGSADHVVNAISIQKDAVGNLDKKIQQLHLRIDQERMQAKQCLSAKTDKIANQNKAKRHLLNARRFQTQVSKFEGMRDNIEAVQATLETAAISKNIHGTLAQGNQALKQMSKELDVDKIADLTEELAESAQNLEEAGNLISQPISSDPGLEMEVDEDMAELLRETAEEEAELVEEVPAVKTKKPAPKIPSLPSAPTTKVVMKAVEDEEDEQLNALMREMN